MKTKKSFGEIWSELTDEQREYLNERLEQRKAQFGVHQADKKSEFKADITKCSGDGCESKYTCYRYTAKASSHQSYFIKPPIMNNGYYNGCEYYINNQD